jgi:hypothetical protein
MTLRESNPGRAGTSLRLSEHHHWAPNLRRRWERNPQRAARKSRSNRVDALIFQSDAGEPKSSPNESTDQSWAPMRMYKNSKSHHFVFVAGSTRVLCHSGVQGSPIASSKSQSTVFLVAQVRFVPAESRNNQPSLRLTEKTGPKFHRYSARVPAPDYSWHLQRANPGRIEPTLEREDRALNCGPEAKCFHPKPSFINHSGSRKSAQSVKICG